MSIELKIIRGSSEIGGTCISVSTEMTNIIIDMGMPLSDEKRETLNFKKIVEDDKKQKAVLLSHGHQDHYGEMNEIPKTVPVFMSEGARSIIKISNLFLRDMCIEIENIQLFEDRKSFNIGDIKITPYRVNHSAFDSYAFLFEHEDKQIFFSGDFRGVAGREKYLFPKLLKDIPKNINILLLEGTRITRNNEKYPTEEAVEKALIKIFEKQENISLITVASQNIDRLVSIYKATTKAKKELIIDPYTAFVLEELGNKSKTLPQYDWRNIRVYFSPNQTKVLLDNGYKENVYRYRKSKITSDEMAERKKDLVFLFKDNRGSRKFFDRLYPLKNANFIWGLWEGYLEDSDLQDLCKEKEMNFYHIHTSGHGGVNEMERLVNAVNPKTVIPVHTQEPEKYKEYFSNVTILPDNKPLKI